MSLFTNKQIEELLKVIELQNVVYIGEQIGVDVLMPNDLDLLGEYNINPTSLLKHHTTVDKAFYFGILSDALGDRRAKGLSYDDFKKFLLSGNFIPLTSIEEETLKHIKKKSYQYIKGAGNKIKDDFYNVLYEENIKLRQTFGGVIKEELLRGVEYRNSTKSIVSMLGHKTGEWERDLGRIVETEMNNIFQYGRMVSIKKRSSEDDPLVYKDVFPGVCRHCIKAYLTNGLGSKPKVFRLSELEKNGTNIGKRVKDWLPTVGSMHPFCRCTLHLYNKDYGFNKQTGKYDKLKEKRPRLVERKSKIKVTVGEKEYLV